jgi:hypothetical protein
MTMLATIGSFSQKFYNARVYAKMAQMGCQWVSFIPGWKDATHSVGERIKGVTGPFLAMGVVASGCRLYRYPTKLMTAGLPFFKRGCQLLGWSQQMKYVSLCERVAFGVNLVAKGLNFILCADKIRKGLTFQRGVLTCASALSLATLFYESHAASFAILALKTSAAVLPLLL